MISVLHLDDDADFLELTHDFLARETAPITIAWETDPEAGLRRLATETFDCVVTDYKMGRLNGLELFDHIRADHPDLPVVFFTGKGSEEIAVEAIRRGVTDYIPKQTGSEQFSLLANRIESLVTGERAKQAAAAADRRIRQVYERITVAFVALDDDLRFTYLNDAAEALLGRPADALVGTRLSDAFPELAESGLEATLEAALLRGRETHAEGRLVVDGDAYMVELHGYPGTDGLSVFLEDVTADHEREVELAELRSELAATSGQFRTLQQKLARPRSPFR
jgi:PAS domain S-box-containing protein